MNRHELEAALRSETNTSFVSNIKFYKLLLSRLSEEDISYLDAIKIVNSLEFDFSNVPEDSDILTQIATATADYCMRVLKTVKMNEINDFDSVLKYFQPPFKLSIDKL